MKKMLVAASLALASAAASAGVLTFDSAPQGYTAVPSYNEAGYTFSLTLGSNGYATHIGDGTYNPGTLNWHDGDDNGAGFLITLTKDDGGLFNFNSFFLDAPFGGAPLTLSAAGYAPLSFSLTGNNTVDFVGVSAVTFTTSSLDGLGIDNVSVDTSQVPEPSVLALIGVGLLGLGCGRNRRRRA